MRISGYIHIEQIENGFIAGGSERLYYDSEAAVIADAEALVRGALNEAHANYNRVASQVCGTAWSRLGARHPADLMEPETDVER